MDLLSLDPLTVFSSQQNPLQPNGPSQGSPYQLRARWCRACGGAVGHEILHLAAPARDWGETQAPVKKAVAQRLELT